MPVVECPAPRNSRASPYKETRVTRVSAALSFWISVSLQMKLLE